MLCLPSVDALAAGLERVGRISSRAHLRLSVWRVGDV